MPSPASSPKLLVAIWVLASIFILLLAWRTAESLPPIGALAMWTTGEFIAVGGSYFLFLRSNDSHHHKERIKPVLWILGSLLELAFVWRMAVTFPATLAFGVILKAGFVTIGGCYGLFIHRNDRELRLPY